jgi:hypothetical protein
LLTLLIAAALAQDLTYATMGERREVELVNGSLTVAPRAFAVGAAASFGVRLEGEHRRDVDPYGTTVLVEYGSVELTVEEFHRMAGAATSCAAKGVARLDAMPFKRGDCRFDDERVSFVMDPDDFELFIRIPCDVRIFVTQMQGAYSLDVMRTATKTYVDPAGDMVLFVSRSNFEDLSKAMDLVSADLKTAGAQ